MKDAKKILVNVLTVTLLFLTIGSSCVFAHESTDSQYVIYDQGYTEDGIEYIAYCLENDNETLSPSLEARIVVSKKVTVVQYYPTDQTPAQSINYSIYDEDYKTTMRGTLYKVKEAYNWQVDKKEVVYEGTIVGNI